MTDHLRKENEALRRLVFRLRYELDLEYLGSYGPRVFETIRKGGVPTPRPEWCDDSAQLAESETFEKALFGDP